MKAFCARGAASSKAFLTSLPHLAPSSRPSFSFLSYSSPLPPLGSIFLSCQQRARLLKDTFLLDTNIRIMAIFPDQPPPGYRANVGLCLINHKNEVFVASRIDLPDSWQMPQGGVDEDEDPRTAAIRELKEETGITSAQIIAEVPMWLTYDFPPDVKARVTQLWGKEWNGQAQRWFLFRFTGDESEIDLDGDGIERPEFSNWKWLPVEDVIEKAVSFKKPVYEQVFKYFDPILKAKPNTLGTSL